MIYEAGGSTGAATRTPLGISFSQRHRQVLINAPVTGRCSGRSRDDKCGQRVDNVASVTLGTGGTIQSNHATVDIVCLPTTSAAT